MADHYDESTSVEHITMDSGMDYPLHRWACQQWGYGPTATARALILSFTVAEARTFLEASDG